MTFTVVLPLPPVALNPHAKGHWRGKAKHTKAARETGMVAAMAATRSQRPSLPSAEVSMTYDVSPPMKVKGYRPKDVQNAIAAVKAYVDGCKDAGLIEDDRAECLTWGQCRIVKEGKPGVTLVFTAKEGLR